MSSAAVAFNAEALRHFDIFRTTVRQALESETIKATFDSFSAFIQKPSTLKAALQLLKASRCDILKKPSPRTLLAAFMVAQFPEDILEISEAEMLEAINDPSRELDRNCHKLAKKVVETFTDQVSALDACLTVLAEFQECFGEWKEFDRQRVLMTLANAHHQWIASLQHLEDSRESTNDLESLEIMVSSVQEQIEANKRRILQMGGPDALDQVLNTPPVVINLDELMQEASSQAYWDEFAKELRATPPTYDRIGTLLSEIRERIKNLIPNRPDMQAEIERGLDIDFIRQMIHFDSFNAESFLGVFNTIWLHLKNFGAASAEAEWEAWRKDIMEKASSGQTTWDILLPEIFNRFLRQLDLIEEATARYRAIMAENQQQESIPAPSSS